MAAFFIASSGYGFATRSIHKCIHQQLKSLLKPFLLCCGVTGAASVIHYKTFTTCRLADQASRWRAAFCLVCPTATYFGQEFFSCGPMWYLLALLVGWILLDVS